MRKVELRAMEQHKYKVIKNLVDKDGNKHRAATKLGVTIRTVNRLINKYVEFGKEGFIHGNRNRIPSNKIDDETRDFILDLYKSNDYSNFNFNHFIDRLLKDHNLKVSYNFIYKLLKDNLILSPKAHRKTKKKVRNLIKAKERENKKLTKAEKILVIENNILDPEDNHARIPRSKYAGELIQMDASEHLWFGDTKTHLHAAIDDATGKIVGAYFDLQETLKGYYKVTHQILTSYGIPYGLITDRRTVFEYKLLKNPEPEYDTLTQFGYACEQLGIQLTTTSIPQAKGRIERLFGTLQSRLINDMIIDNITTIEQANEYLKTYIKEFNDKFSLNYNIPHVYEKIDNDVDLNLILARVSTRVVDRGSSIKFKNRYYQVYDENGLLLNLKHKTSITVIEAFNKKLYCSINERYYKLFELEDHYEVSKEIDLIETSQEEEKKRTYTPPMSHPWKEKSYQNYINRNGK